MQPSILRSLEKKLGLPSLDSVSRSLNQFPDAKQLKLIKDVLTVAERVASTAPELDKVAELIREINSMPTEKLEKVEKVLKRVERIMKTAPQELTSFLSGLGEE
ncbi:hypothetical protein ES707_03425 [subsurface metagenome]